MLQPQKRLSHAYGTLPDGSEWARVAFPPELFSLIERTARKMGITLQRFFDNAMRQCAAKCGNLRDA
jgi:hypothetical protein